MVGDMFLFFIAECGAINTSVDAFFTSFSLQYYVDFLYREKFHNNTSFLLADAILLIGITNFISPPVYQMGYIGLQLKYFSVLCNNKLQ